MLVGVGGGVGGRGGCTGGGQSDVLVTFPQQTETLPSLVKVDSLFVRLFSSVVAHIYKPMSTL